MKKNRKLTATTLKRIIAEEKYKLLNEIKSEKSKTASKKKKRLSSLLKEIAMILTIKKHQQKKVNELKKLHEMKIKLKKNLVKRI